ncbi:MAG: outer membrane lipoprotein chaperone LolA [Desulfovibrio sp.]|jgi:outer membrane lipoprotein carrier protein|nr:outer membrane lipoprotein chaperone LolA [Desulfovibrio sp.]
MNEKNGGGIGITGTRTGQSRPASWERTLAPLKACIALAATILFLAVPVASPGASDIAARMQRTYSETSTFTADFEQTLTHRESGAVEKRQGSLQFRKPMLVRWETVKPARELLTVTPKEVWNYLPDEEVAYRYPLSVVQDSRSIIQVLTGQAALTKDFDVKEKGSEAGTTTLLLYPKEPSTQLVEARLTIETSTGFIQRAVLADFYGNLNDVRFTRLVPNASLPASAFTFTPPKGVEVEDRSKDAGGKLLN